MKRNATDVINVIKEAREIMSTQMIICILLFVLMLFSFLLGKLPLGVIAGTTASLLVLTGCTSPETILSGLGSSNTVILARIIIQARITV